MKSPFQDIIPPEKRSIRNITLSDEKSPKEKASVDHHSVSHAEVKPRKKRIAKAEEDDDAFTAPVTFKGQSSFSFSKIVLWCIAFVSVVTVFFVVTRFLNTATIKIETKSWQIDMPAKLNLSLQPTTGQVGYSTVTFSDTLSDTLPATGEKDASTKSTGTILIYNNFSTASQKLVAGTRFESSKGLIFKIDKTITVPGTKKVSGKIVPGSIEATVTADTAGKDYNIALDDFTIPGFKGTSKFDKIYARSKTPMTGGSVGKVATVADSDLSKKVADIEAKLVLKLKDRMTKELPLNQVVIDGLSNTTYQIGTPKFENNSAKVEITSNTKIYLLDSNTLASSLLAPENIKVNPGDEFTFITGGVKGVLASTTDSVSGINFNGKITVISKLDMEKFKADVAGVSNADIPSIAAKYGAISKISTAIKPFWKSSLPSDVSKITILTN